MRFWAKPPINRLDFVMRVVEQLDQQGWPNKTDVGNGLEVWQESWQQWQQRQC